MQFQHEEQSCFPAGFQDRIFASKAIFFSLSGLEKKTD
jgi:hypothetical protein